MTTAADLIPRATALIERWQERWGPFETHSALAPDPERLAAAWEAFAERMQDHYPFFHPRFAGQMLKPPHPVAVAGYLAAMLVNPNNHALDGGPGTSAMEREVVQRLATMLRLPEDALGHLTSGGTVANTEALWVARELHPDRGVLFSDQSHYTHGRMSSVLRMDSRPVPSDARGRMDLEAAEALLNTGRYGTLVLTTGTTGLGAVDRVDEALALRERHGVRLHVDAAYGGFFTAIADECGEATAALKAIGEADSVVIDPHKHGLQPYGCGAVLFREPAVGRFYKHDSPFTYFTSAELHLGEISLECSRAGAAAAALWLTLEAIDLRPILTAALRAARALAARLGASEVLALHLQPELDIVTYLPRAGTLADVDRASRVMLELGMADREDPVFLSVVRLSRAALLANHPWLAGDEDGATIARSVLMKPEHEPAVDGLAGRLEHLAAAALAQ